MGCSPEFTLGYDRGRIMTEIYPIVFVIPCKVILSKVKDPFCFVNEAKMFRLRSV